MPLPHAKFRLRTLLCALTSFAALSACSAGSGDDTTGSGAGSPGSTSDSGSGANGSGGGFNGSNTTGAGGFEQCTGVSATAMPQKQPADVILAVDTSGSMDEEIAEVQQNLNAFAGVITQSGIDVHLVMIADANMCIPAPLGSGSCAGADEKLPAYRHVLQVVSSTDALDLFLSTYDQWKGNLRPNASKTLLVVSDDNASLSAGSFKSQLEAIDPPTFVGFKFDAIVAHTDPLACFGFTCPTGNPCCYTPVGFGCDSYAAEKGVEYESLVAATGGVSGDLCAQEFDPIFNDIAQGVIVASQLACDYAIPPAPEGQTLDPSLVNVSYTPGGQTTPTPILNVPGGAQDCGAAGGWYYDDPANPAHVIMCPSTCTTLQADTGGSVDVVFGCATQVVPQ